MQKLTATTRIPIKRPNEIYSDKFLSNNVIWLLTEIISLLISKFKFKYLCFKIKLIKHIKDCLTSPDWLYSGASREVAHWSCSPTYTKKRKKKLPLFQFSFFFSLNLTINLLVFQILHSIFKYSVKWLTLQAKTVSAAV